MLETLDLEASLSKSEYKDAMDALDLRLGALQRQLRSENIPMMVILEGWDAAGKGTVLNRLLRPLDPRGFAVHTINAPTSEERLYPPLRRFWRMLPADGTIAILDSSWYTQELDRRVLEKAPEHAWRQSFERIRTFERQLTDHGMVILKFWLHISKKEQAKRFKKLQKDKATAWRVDKTDEKRHKKYDEYVAALEEMLPATSAPSAPWRLIAAHDKRRARVQICEAAAAAAENALNRPEPPAAAEPVRAPRRTSPLDRVDLSLKVDRSTYDDELPDLQKELRRLEHRMYIHRIPAILVYEGWDAGGKGGNIRRLTKKLDPRGYDVHAVGPPSGAEKRHHYLWRFWKALPKAGHMAIFDRSWYGRVLVERVEGFASPEEWQRAYQEINAFEHELINYGAVLVKFWLHISPEEQLERFEDRQNTPHKRWKITDEDWRNREKWDAYYLAASDMIERTSTAEAPWTIVEGDDKPHARLKAIRVVIDALKTRLDKA
jgi:polyphosphate:AMP phosphotransferase